MDLMEGKTGNSPHSAACLRLAGSQPQTHNAEQRPLGV